MDAKVLHYVFPVFDMTREQLEESVEALRADYAALLDAHQGLSPPPKGNC
jgi:hypothetical protein